MIKYNFLEKMRDLQMTADWQTVRVGWEGLINGQRLVSMDQINRLSGEVVQQCSDAELPWIAELATARDDATVSNALAALAPVLEPANSDAFAKWTCVLLAERLQTLAKDEVYGLVELNDFWASLGNPPHSPHVIQGVGNSLTPQAYYSKENFQRLRAAHEAWLASEVRRLSCKA